MLRQSTPHTDCTATYIKKFLKETERLGDKESKLEVRKKENTGKERKGRRRERGKRRK